MKHFKGFVKYKPVSPLPDDFPLENIGDPNITHECRRHFLAKAYEDSEGNEQRPLFEHDQYGRCWYDAIHDFDADTIKIVYSAKTGKVISFSKDASSLFPHGENVIEVAEVPEGFEADKWMVDANDHLCLFADGIAAINKGKQSSLLIKACAHLVALQVMPDKTGSELVQLQALNEYVIGVKRTDVSVLEPEWPTSPI